MYKIKLPVLAFVIIAIGFSACSKKYYLERFQSNQVKISEQIKADSAIIAFYKPYKQSLDSQMNRVIGYTSEELKKNLPESKLGNFFADAVAATCAKQGIMYDVVFPTSNGGMRSSLPEGKITLGNVFELMPFENELVLLKLNAAQMRMLAQYIIDKGGQPVSGIRITAINTTLTDLTIGGEQVNESKLYNVITSDYLAGGGDDVNAFKGVEHTRLSLKVRDAIQMYIEEESKQGRIINPEIDGRINIIK